MRKIILILSLLMAAPTMAQTYDLVLEGGRILDPETGLDAIRKMSLMPAQRMERATPSARRKGRLQEGADADMVVVGALLIDRGQFVPNTFPGKPL